MNEFTICQETRVEKINDKFSIKLENFKLKLLEIKQFEVVDLEDRDKLSNLFDKAIIDLLRNYIKR